MKQPGLPSPYGFAAHQIEADHRSGSHSHVLPERSVIKMRVGDGLSSVNVAFAIDGDELRSVPR